MSRRHFLFVIGARALPPKMAVSRKLASPSAALGTLRAAINDQDSKPIEITPDQWKFLPSPRRSRACALLRADPQRQGRRACRAHALDLAGLGDRPRHQGRELGLDRRLEGQVRPSVHVRSDQCR